MREVVDIVPNSPLATPSHWATRVLAFTPINAAQNLLRSCKAWREEVDNEGSDTWIVLKETAARQFGVYVSPHFSRSATDGCTHREDFRSILESASMWATLEDYRDNGLPPPAAAAQSTKGFKINVFARFRPLDILRASRGGKRIVLPLHQKLEGIKQINGYKTTAEAARHLMKERGLADAADAKPFDDATVRIGNRPVELAQSAAEPDTPGSRATILDVQRKGIVVAVAPSIGIRPFEFDAAFGGSCPQGEVYAAAAAPFVAEFLNGIDSCCIVYGQTGSGKTHTMFGHPEAPGIVPRACEEIFDAVEQRNSLIKAYVSISYIQVYGDEVTDLLDYGAPVAPNKSAAQRWVLEGRAQRNVSTLEETLNLIDQGELQKRRAATKMNERSTRAHCILTVSLSQQHRETKSMVSSVLVLADLGGSEDTIRSGVADGIVSAGFAPDWAEYYRKKERMMEAIHINQGLLALKNCIRQLHLRQGGSDVHIPYQDSKLTLLLASVLGGKARTSIVITGSPDPSDGVDTIHTLRFGEACKKIITTAGQADTHQKALKKIVADLDEEIRTAEEAVKAAEKWVRKKVTKTRQQRESVDGEEEEDTGIIHRPLSQDEKDVVTVYRLEGAVEEAEQLRMLLEKRRRLLGA
ncbi:Kinesin-like protein [Diplonema papillatum]|nr:Kinesin-like protein [Diplonema papillatum]KAJ9439417.1 Kinesin-like protein [Diplonema papillatum]